LSEGLAGQGFTDEVEVLLLETAEVSATFGEWFSRLMLMLFHQYGLIVVEPGLPELKRLAIPLFEQALEDPLVPSQLANETGDILEERGYQRQLHKTQHSAAFPPRKWSAWRYTMDTGLPMAPGPSKADLKSLLQDSLNASALTRCYAPLCPSSLPTQRLSAALGS
jgi:hypothetical protein